MSLSESVYLHYLNANVEGRLPHALEFGSIYGRIITEMDVNGQVVTVVSYGFPRRYYMWSTFSASLRIEEYMGKTVIQGSGWHLCPPREVSENNISYLVEGKIRDHLFIPVTDQRAAKWLLHIVNRRRPPDNPASLRSFLLQMHQDVGNEDLESKIEKALRSLKR